MRDYPQQVIVVPIDYPVIPPSAYNISGEIQEYVAELPAWAQEYFALGRIAIKTTKSKQVVALGGGGIAAKEATAGFQDGVKWTVYALSRGRVEEFPTMCDFAREQVGKGNGNIELITGKDPEEGKAFCQKN